MFVPFPRVLIHMSHTHTRTHSSWKLAVSSGRLGYIVKGMTTTGSWIILVGVLWEVTADFSKLCQATERIPMHETKGTVL